MSKLPMRYRVRYACQRCIELLEIQKSEMSDGGDVCECDREACPNPIHYDPSLPFKHQDAIVAFFQVDEWFDGPDNDNFARDDVKEDFVDLLAYCTGYAAEHNPFMSRMFVELIRDLQEEDDEKIANDNANQKRALH